MKKYAGILLVIVLIIALLGACDEDSMTNGGTSEQNAPDNQSAQTSGESTDSNTGTIVVRMHDAPPDYAVKAVLVTIDGIEVHRAIAEQDQAQVQSGTGSAAGDAVMQQDREQIQEQSQLHSGTGSVGEDAIRQQESAQGWEPVSISGSRTIDVLQYQDGLEALMGVQEMEAGRYTQVRMTVSKIEVLYMQNSGTSIQSSTAKIPSGQLKFVRPFDIVAGGTTVLSFDFDAEKSVNFTGSGEVIVKPVIKLDVYREGNGRSGENSNNEKGDGNGGFNKNDPVQNGPAAENKVKEGDQSSGKENQPGNGDGSDNSNADKSGRASEQNSDKPKKPGQ